MNEATRTFAHFVEDEGICGLGYGQNVSDTVGGQGETWDNKSQFSKNTWARIEVVLRRGGLTFRHLGDYTCIYASPYAAQCTGDLAAD